MRTASHYLRGVPQVDALFDKAQLSGGPPIGEMLSRAWHVAQRARIDFSRCSDVLACARRESARDRHESARTDADLHSRQVKEAPLETCVQALEMARTFVPDQGPAVGYGTGYSYAPLRAVPTYTPGKRCCEAANEEPSWVALPQIVTHVSQAPMTAYQASLQASYVMPMVSDTPYAAQRARAEGGRSAHAGAPTHAAPLHIARGGEMVGSGEGEPQRQRATDLYQPAYSSYNVPSEKANLAAVQKRRSSESTVEAPLRSYRARFREPFARRRDLPLPKILFTGDSGSSGAHPGRSYWR